MASIKKTTGILTGFLLGGAIGGVIALLYAPKSGKQFRTDISRKTNKLIEDSKRKTIDTWDGAREIAESTLENANEVLNSNIEKIAHKTDKIKEAYNAGYNAYNNERTTGKSSNISELENAENTHKKR